MKTRFYNTLTSPSHPTQGVRKKAKQQRLSKEARAAVNARRRKASENFQNDLDDAWTKIDEAAENIAASHHKSIRRVQAELHMGRQLARTKRTKTNAWNAFCWKKSQEKGNNAQGKEVLQRLVCDHQAEYNALTNEEREKLVEEFNKYKATLTKAKRISTRAIINDATHTLTAVENELRNLQSRAGIEVMLFATRGATNVPLKSVGFATDGVKKFLEGAMKTDKQDFLVKMEGFAVQGVCGAAKNHQQRVSILRADIRNEIIQTLRNITGDENARMEWKNYWRNVVKRYQVIIEGWPKDIPFKSLSEVSSALPELEALLRKWRCGTIYWKKLTSAELQVLCDERDKQIEGGDIEAPSRRRRSDYGKKRIRQREGDENSRKRQKVTSEDVIGTDDENNSSEDDASVPGPTTSNPTVHQTSNEDNEDLSDAGTRASSSGASVEPPGLSTV